MSTYNLSLNVSACWYAPEDEMIDTVGISISGPGPRMAEFDGILGTVPLGFQPMIPRIVANKAWVAPGLYINSNGVIRAFFEKGKSCDYLHSLLRYQDKVNALRITCPQDSNLAIQVITDGITSP